MIYPKIYPQKIPLPLKLHQPPILLCLLFVKIRCKYISFSYVIIPRIPFIIPRLYRGNGVLKLLWISRALGREKIRLSQNKFADTPSLTFPLILFYSILPSLTQ